MSVTDNRRARSGGAATGRVPRPAGAAHRGSRWVHGTDGSAAYAPVEVEDWAVEEPVRRSAAARAAADERAAHRAAERAAVAARRRLGVAPPSPVAVARAPFVVMLISIVLAGVVGILVLNTMITANQFRLNHLQSQQPALDQQEQQLRQDLAQQESPGSLVAAAKKLGLVPAGTLAYIKLPDGTVVGVPQPATSTSSVTHQTGPTNAPAPSAPPASPGATSGPGVPPSPGTSPWSGVSGTPEAIPSGNVTPAGMAPVRPRGVGASSGG